MAWLDSRGQWEKRRRLFVVEMPAYMDFSVVRDIAHRLAVEMSVPFPDCSGDQSKSE